MTTTAEHAVSTLLNPEQFREGAPKLIPTGLDNFALLRAHMDRLAATMEQDNQQGARRGGGEAAKPVTATVTRRPRRRNQRKEIFPVTTGPQTVPNQTPNVPTFESLLQVATELGEQAGKGKDTQIKFDLKVLEGAYLGALSLDPNKHGAGRRDGMLLAEAYVKAQQGAIIFDARSDKSRKLISNVDKMIKLGQNPKWGPGQPLTNVNELVTHRQTLRKDPATAKKLEDAHNMLMRYATAQIKSDTLIDGDARNQFAFKKNPDERTVEEVWEGIRKLATKLRDGKIAHCSGLDNSSETTTIINTSTKRLKAIAAARGAGTP